MKVSVIVPVYNVEQYLRRCIDSIINQTYKNLEIILVDDGSPDNCGDICEEYLLRDNRIRVIHKENGGISSARNVGLDNINGEYIVFVDSDDFIEPELIESCLNYIRSNGVDIVFFNWKVLHKDKEVFHSINKTFMKSYEDAFRGILEDKTPCYVWNKFYKRKLWDDIRFPLGVNVEDLIVMPHVLMRAKRIGYIE